MSRQHPGHITADEPLTRPLPVVPAGPAPGAAAGGIDLPAQYVDAIQYVEAIAIPETGQILFVIHVDEDQLADDGGEAVVADLYRLAEKLAPGRAQVAVMTSGITLEVLTDEQLAPLGLQRADTVEKLLELHTPRMDDGIICHDVEECVACDVGDGHQVQVCSHCQTGDRENPEYVVPMFWPCPTAKILGVTGALPLPAKEPA